MNLCPRCRQRLWRAKAEHGFVYCCPRCKGRAVSFSVLRRVAPAELVRQLWSTARQKKGIGGARCPACSRWMVELPVPVEGSQVTLDVCTRCQFLWFDACELEQIPARAGKRGQAPFAGTALRVLRTKGACPLFPEPSERDRLPEKAREQVAMMQLKSLQDREAAAQSDETPDEAWKWLPALLGLPVEVDAEPVGCWPWVTWGLCAALVLVFALTFHNLEQAVREFGLIPAQLWRHGGLTLLTSLFLHGGIWHLLGNVYFLLIFGDNVEDDLGRRRFALLLAAAALAGSLAHILADPHSVRPAIGASVGISGVIVYYAFRFPRARLGFLIRYWTVFRWCYIPACAWLILWLVLQGWLAVQQFAGTGQVSAMAHLGGAAVGVGGWLFCRRPVMVDELPSKEILR